MKMKKRLISLTLALCMVMALAIPTFAAEPDELPDLHDPRVQSHTIEVTLEPGEDLTEGDVMPLMWGQQGPTVPASSNAHTDTFFVYDRYFAFEVSATGTNGQAVSGNMAAALMSTGSVRAAASGKANGAIYKYDWLSLNSGPYYFIVYNYTSSALKFTLTYYSWA